MMRHKLRVANYMFGAREHSFICQPPRGLRSGMARDTYLLREQKGAGQLPLFCNTGRGGRTQPAIRWRGCLAYLSTRFEATTRSVLRCHCYTNSIQNISFPRNPGQTRDAQISGNFACYFGLYIISALEAKHCYCLHRPLASFIKPNYQ